VDDVTRIGIRYGGYFFELRTEMPWDQVMNECQKRFSSSSDWIGGPKPPVEPQVKQRKGARLASA
jgi:hypothetical protein